MSGYASECYNDAKKWVSQKIEEGFNWDDVVHFCVDSDSEHEAFEKLQYDDCIIPPSMDFDDWVDFVRETKSNYSPITEIHGISDGESNILPIPIYTGSAWVNYKKYLLGEKTGKAKMSDTSVDRLENNCHWILNHLERDTRAVDPVKGLVMGSVQSGKTANMIGLVSMAADYDWNIFIILSGTIESLRKQTRNRFCEDLNYCGGLSWRVLDYTSNADYMVDVKTKERYLTDDLKLNSFQNGQSQGKWKYRYVFVCLKNYRRLKNLIEWLHSKTSAAAKMRILVIDDEADQASINTAKMSDDPDDDDFERTRVNQLIIDLIQGRDSEGAVTPAVFQAMNYISYTATPYANVLNEAYKGSLYPSNFIFSLPEPAEYFGPKAIWGSAEDEKYPGLNIIRIIPKEEVNELKSVQRGYAYTLPVEFQKSIAWFLCAAAILRRRNYKKPISMLIHTTSLQNGHFEVYDTLRNWLTREANSGGIVSLCEKVYDEEKNEFRLEDLKNNYPDYGKCNEVCDDFPEFNEIKSEINDLLENIVNIGLGEDKQFVYTENGIHLCVDNCRANRVADEGTFLRIVYPSDKELSEMKKAPVFIVMGGNTLSRGLTLEGLVCTYFARNVNQVDTLLQMARWFGYRSGYELLQRIWMPLTVYEKFAEIEKVDEYLKKEFEDFVTKGKSPSLFGPKVLSTPQIARFLLTSKNKSQNMIACDLDFTGDSYEVTQYENSKADLEHNINITEKFLKDIGYANKSEAIESAYVWYDIDSNYVVSDFLNKYTIFECSPLHNDIPFFLKWLKDMNENGKFLKWNIAVAGDKKSNSRWIVSGADVGKIERSRKVKSDYIDIGSLRSGRDILSDICVSELPEDKRMLFEARKKSGKNLISLKYELGYGDHPLLLLYRIDKDKGQESKLRTKIGSDADIIGFSIIIAGEETNNGYIETVWVNMPD